MSLFINVPMDEITQLSLAYRDCLNENDKHKAELQTARAELSLANAVCEAAEEFNKHFTIQDINWGHQSMENLELAIARWRETANRQASVDK